MQGAPLGTFVFNGPAHAGPAMVNMQTASAPTMYNLATMPSLVAPNVTQHHDRNNVARHHDRENVAQHHDRDDLAPTLPQLGQQMPRGGGGGGGGPGANAAAWRGSGAAGPHHGGHLGVHHGAHPADPYAGGPLPDVSIVPANRVRKRGTCCC